MTKVRLLFVLGVAAVAALIVAGCGEQRFEQ